MMTETSTNIYIKAHHVTINMHDENFIISIEIHKNIHSLSENFNIQHFRE